MSYKRLKVRKNSEKLDVGLYKDGKSGLSSMFKGTGGKILSFSDFNFADMQKSDCSYYQHKTGLDKNGELIQTGFVYIGEFYDGCIPNWHKNFKIISQKTGKAISDYPVSDFHKF